LVKIEKQLQLFHDIWVAITFLEFLQYTGVDIKNKKACIDITNPIHYLNKKSFEFMLLCC